MDMLTISVFNLLLWVSYFFKKVQSCSFSSHSQILGVLTCFLSIPNDSHLLNTSRKEITDESDKGSNPKRSKESKRNTLKLKSTSILHHSPSPSTKLTSGLCRSPAHHLLSDSESMLMLPLSQQLEDWVKLSRLVTFALKKQKQC